MSRRSVNKVIIIGNLGSEPELRHTPSNVPVANFSVATNESWVNKDGMREERTEWHRIVAWRRLAEICSEYLHKGTQVYIEGRIQTRQWEDQNGQKRYQTEIVADEMVILGGRPGEGMPSGAPPYSDDEPIQSSRRQADDNYDDFQPPEGEADDDLPF